MALTIQNAVKKAALDAIAALFNNGTFQLTNTAGGAGSVLATLTFGATAFAAATTASPSTAASNAITPASSPTAGTVLGFNLRSSTPTTLISGNVGTSGSDINVTDNVIPAGATSVSCSGLTLSLQVV